MTNATKHTPTPWKVGYKNTVGVVSQEDDQSFGMVIPFIDVYGDNPSANADHIVKCVNMHDELVGVLLSALNELEEHEKWSHENDVCITTNLDIIKRIKSITSNFEG